jgi:hypothetical protein
MISVSICSGQLDSMRRQWIFHEVLLYCRGNTTTTFRKFIIPVLMTGRTSACSVHQNLQQLKIDVRFF